MVENYMWHKNAIFIVHNGYTHAIIVIINVWCMQDVTDPDI